MLITAVFASETGSNKQTASKSCALSLVRQLYHLQVIEPFSGTLKKNRDADMKPFETTVDPTLIENVRSILTELNITPVSTANASPQCGATLEDVSLKVNF